MKSWIALLLCCLMLCACTVPFSPPEPQSVVPETDPISVPKDTDLPEKPFPMEADPSEPSETVQPDTPISEGTIDLSVIDSYDKYAYVLANATLDGESNQNLSPYSLYFALVMLAEGAGGKTQEQLVSFLGAESMEALRLQAVSLLESVSREEELSIVDTHNSLWMEKNHRDAFLSSYLTALEAYRSEVHAVDFTTSEATEKITEWISAYTRGTIEPELQLPPTTKATLVNTVYLLANWVDPFDEKNTADDVFTSADGAEHTVPFMKQGFHNVSLVQGDGFLRFSVEMHGDLWMTFVLPDADQPLSRLLWRDGVEKLLTSGTEQRCDVQFSMPSYSFDSKFELMPLLASLGLTHLFGEEADFSNLSSLPLALDSILQETYLDVNEHGVEAAAYTAILLRAEGGFLPQELPLVEFTLDRPFLFAIEAQKGGTPVFIGTMVSP